MRLRLSVRRPLAALLLLAALTPLGAQPGRASATDPDRARLVTSDLPNFWRAFDAAAGQDSASRVRAFEEVYLRPGSIGLATFARVRLSRGATVRAALAAQGWDSARVARANALPDTSAERRALAAASAPLVLHSAAETLARATARLPRFYGAIRANTLAIDTARAVTDAIRAGMRRLETLYPDAVFPDVYFLIGEMSTGGTPDGGRGLLMGTELFARDATTPLDELNPWMRSVVGGFDRLPWLVAHEVAHAQQRGGGSAASRTLLGRALGEGCADFVADLLIPNAPAPAYRAYGAANEPALWTEFRAAMLGTDTQQWLFNGQRSTDRPADLGYHVGSRICASYYERAGDKARALGELFAAQGDPEGFLKASGYAERVGRP